MTMPLIKYSQYHILSLVVWLSYHYFLVDFNWYKTKNVKYERQMSSLLHLFSYAHKVHNSGWNFTWLQNIWPSVCSKIMSYIRKSPSIPVRRDITQEMAIITPKIIKTASVTGTRMVNGSNGSLFGGASSSNGFTCTRGLLFLSGFAFEAVFRRVRRFRPIVDKCNYWNLRWQRSYEITRN